jgi:predicted NAD-dependent protein-ADP-ribosyltransferase YbiA (DUF1768 family)
MRGVTFVKVIIYKTSKKKYKELHKIIVAKLVKAMLKYLIPFRPDLKESLLKTGDSHIYLTRKPFDMSFFPTHCSIYTAEGHNLWGKAMMKVREILRKNEQ